MIRAIISFAYTRIAPDPDGVLRPRRVEAMMAFNFDGHAITEGQVVKALEVIAQQHKVNPSVLVILNIQQFVQPQPNVTLN